MQNVTVGGQPRQRMVRMIGRGTRVINGGTHTIPLDSSSIPLQELKSSRLLVSVSVNGVNSSQWAKVDGRVF